MSVAVNFNAVDGLVAPEQDYEVLAAKVMKIAPTSNPMELPCADVGKLPDIVFNIYSEDYKLSGADYAQPLPTDAKTCHVLVSATPEKMFWTLGSVFHRKYGITYDFVGNTIGFPRLSAPYSWWSTNWVSVVVPSAFAGLWVALMIVFKTQKTSLAAGAGGAPAGGAAQA